LLLTGLLAASDEGFEAPGIEVFDPPHWFDIKVGSLTLYLNKAEFLTLLAGLFVLFMWLWAFRRPRLVPRGVQNLMESIYDFVDSQIARDVIGYKEGPKYTPYLCVLFTFVLVCNVMAILPIAQFPATARIAVPMMLSVITWVMFNYVGIKKHGAGHYFGEMAKPPGVPTWLLPLLTPIELFSTLLVRPFTLAVRLFANMFAGHMLLLIFSLGAAYLLPRPPYIWGVASLLLSIVLTGFELVIDVLQAYIITILTAAYIGGALEGHGGEAEEAMTDEHPAAAPAAVPQPQAA
jgi:F-type H+-transporting ATPase subunit a